LGKPSNVREAGNDHSKGQQASGVDQENADQEPACVPDCRSHSPFEKINWGEAYQCTANRRQERRHDDASQGTAMLWSKPPYKKGDQNYAYPQECRLDESDVEFRRRCEVHPPTLAGRCLAKQHRCPSDLHLGGGGFFLK
jgi:hypothetical protein